MKKISMLLIAALFALLSCNDKYPDLEDGIYAEFITDQGTMVAELYYEDAPATVANFVALAEGTHPMVDSAYANKPYYNGLKFHRIIKDFMIQGGDPEGTGRGGPGYKFHDELLPTRRHDSKGVLSMANSGENTNGSQFFITHKATPHLDGFDQNGGRKNCGGRRVSCHTVWGKTVIGLEVIDAITGVEMTSAGGSSPKEDVIMREVNIIRIGTAAKNFDAPATFAKELDKYANRFSEFKNRFNEKLAKAEELPSGLKIHWDHKAGGQKPVIGDSVNVKYAGFFAESGELFDTSIEEVARSQDKFDQRRKDAIGYNPLGTLYSPDAALVPGFKEGLQLLSIGDKITLFIPSHLGYGASGYPGAIPPNSDLVFELELVGIKEKQ
ncbi:peptidylprolyl isomerase [uncultured Dokdonia sp.]|uniref:peptidylprolyl isomerase n=1 Tax=uncultured Dokdonia sp. TaxID=575653 RepID=UPI00260A80BC|nr:peptidylprolyl isomerase [uncultured Dokdonia sp.]